ncbi:hypothetical protein [Oceanospirillum beijerinckii]|uniref:hypothetical protein n=1 Tax=Oceanospirillum beijerinckii TaxID=64976 RepID=UPI0004211F28|nr:hypothetical protein [Oceanospirillum beijerinckii]
MTIQASPVNRDANGYWTHPDYLYRDESTSDETVKQWEQDNKITTTVIHFEDDAPEELLESDNSHHAIRFWQPAMPPGSFLLSIHDTEDWGAVAIIAHPDDYIAERIATTTLKEINKLPATLVSASLSQEKDCFAEQYAEEECPHRAMNLMCLIGLINGHMDKLDKNPGYIGTLDDNEAFEFEELIQHLCETDDGQHKRFSPDELILRKYGVTVEQFHMITKDLLALTPLIKTAIDNQHYHAFVDHQDKTSIMRQRPNQQILESIA